MKCSNHPEADAVGACVNCGSAVCDACTTRIAKKIYCPNCADDFDSIKTAAQPNIVINQSASSSASAAAAAPGLPAGYQIKNPGMAALISFFFAGGGQIYNGQVGKGIIMALLTYSTIWFGLGFLFYIWSIFDAYNSAKMINARGW